MNLASDSKQLIQNTTFAEILLEKMIPRLPHKGLRVIFHSNKSPAMPLLFDSLVSQTKKGTRSV